MPLAAKRAAARIVKEVLQEAKEVWLKDARASHWSPSRLQPQEATRLTGEALAVLPEPQRRTIEMFFFEGLTLREIAERRNENYPNVRNHYYRGLERLRSYLQPGPRPVASTIIPTGEA